MLFASTPLVAQHGPPVDLSALARGADRIVVATVTQVTPAFQRNEFGDELIVSHTRLRIEAGLKGRGKAGEQDVVLELEGGTIGDLTLEVSDLPSLERGDRAVVFLRQNRRGAFVPHGRGQGILKLDSTDHVHGSHLTLSDVRQAVERAR
jgi:hypothetical protein